MYEAKTTRDNVAVVGKGLLWTGRADGSGCAVAVEACGRGVWLI